jgi:hypothetical protein
MPATELPASLENGHVFITMTEGTFVLDTGSPASFAGRVSSLMLEQKRFSLRETYMGLTADKLSAHVGRHVDGWLGTDILNELTCSWTYRSHACGFRPLPRYPAAGRVTDFYPGFGSFSTDTFVTPFQFGRTHCTLRCGRLPTVLGMTLMLAEAEGIVAHELLLGRRVGYFPRRRLLVLFRTSQIGSSINLIGIKDTVMFRSNDGTRRTDLSFGRT